MTSDRDALEVPHARCRQCGAYVPKIEIERNICIDCQIENQKRGNKRKGYRNDNDGNESASG